MGQRGYLTKMSDLTIQVAQPDITNPDGHAWIAKAQLQ